MAVRSRPEQVVHRTRRGTWPPSSAPVPGAVLHEVRVTGRLNVVVDLVANVGWVVDGAARASRPAGPDERRMVLLDWCRRRMPVVTPTAFWWLETALIAARLGDPRWHLYAADRLPEALAGIGRSRLLRPADLRLLLRAAHDPGSRPDVGLLDELAGQLRQLLRGIARTRPGGAGPGDSGSAGSSTGRSDVEWDRLPWFTVDARDQALRCRRTGRVWSVELPTRARPKGSAAPAGQLWVRQVQASTGAVLSQAEMSWRDGLLRSTGILPAAPAGGPIRIDVTGYLGLAPRAPQAHALVLAEQAVFRALLCSRMAHDERGLTDWAEVYWHRAADRLAWHLGLLVKHRPDQVARPAAGSQGRFLAEELLTPAHLGAPLPEPEKPS